MSYKYFRPFLFVPIAVAFFCFNLQYIGPAYLSDEIGYLNKAAAFAGYGVDGASSWFGGYSLLIAPLFYTVKDPFVLWKTVLFFHATMWATNFYLMSSIFNRLYNIDSKRQSVYILMAILYPSWISISGYAFASTIFSLFFTFSVYLLLVLDLRRYGHTFLLSLVIGYLFWIHPVGAVVAVASLIAIFYRYKLNNIPNVVFYVFMLLAMMLFYKFGVHAWLNAIMTPKGYEAKGHYTSLSSIVSTMQHFGYWENWLILVFGQLSYGAVATFGMFMYALFYAIKKCIGGQSKNKYNYLLVYMVLAPLFIIFLGAASFALNASNTEYRADIWICGRYFEMALPPLLIMGAYNLKNSSVKVLIIVVAMVGLFGLFLNGYLTTSYKQQYFNEINIQSFWPRAILGKVEIYKYFILASFAVVIVYLARKNLLILLMVVTLIYGYSIFYHSKFHKEILSGYSKPSSFIGLISDNHKEGGCVGFDPYLPNNPSRYLKERRLLYTYYLHRYDFRRMSPDEWYKNCDGPFLTFNNNSFLNNEAATYVAREQSSGLFFVVKNEYVPDIRSRSNAGDIIYGDDKYIRKGCFSQTAEDLQNFSQVGNFKNNRLSSTNMSGYLFFGPYKSLEDGAYKINLNMNIHTEGCINLDIVSNAGENKIFDTQICKNSAIDGGFSIPFTLQKGVSGIEVRLYVTDKDSVDFLDYAIVIDRTTDEI